MSIGSNIITINEAIRNGNREHPLIPSVSPTILDDVTITTASPIEIDKLVDKSTEVFNRELGDNKKKVLTSIDITQIKNLYQNVFNESQYLVCKTSAGEMIGSLCTTKKTEYISFRIETEFNSYLNNYNKPQYTGNIFFGSMTFIDKHQIGKLNLKQDLAIKLWRQMLTIAAQTIINAGNDGVYLSYSEKSALGAAKRVLGMPWIEIGDEITWLNTSIIPSLITTDQLKKWLGA